jgi:olefin beta-lactone synthetase
VSATENASIVARLLERAALHPERPAVVEARPRRVTSFGALAAGAAAVSRQLAARGVAPGEGVLLFVPMSAALYASLLGILHRGCVAVFVDAWTGRARLEAAIAAAAPAAFIGTTRAHLLRAVSPALRRIPVKLRPLTPRDGGGGADAPHPRASTDAALVTFTTGSTGAPRAAVRTHGFLWAQHRALAEHLGLTERDVDMPTLPIFVLNNLALGVPSVLPAFDPRHPARIRPERIRRQMVAEGVTTTSGSPAFYHKLCRWCRDNELMLPVRALFTGGAPVYPPLAELLAERTSGAAHVVYGSTEAEPISGIEARALLAAAAEGEGICVGRPVDGIRVRIIVPHDGPVELGETGWGEWDLPLGEAGEIVVAGGHVLRGYLGDPEGERAAKIRDGNEVWHRTGDGGRLDASGRLWLVGRVGQRVRREGRTWWSTPAELRALALPGVVHAAYLGAADPTLGQRAVICLEVPGGPRPSRERVRAALEPSPVDDLVVMRSIPRDPRHASKTDLPGLRGSLDMPEW